MSEFTNPNDYQKEAQRTQCDQIRALQKIGYHSLSCHSPRAITLLHGVIGLMGELGELAGILERWLWYGQPFDRINFIEELGDVQWYMAELHNAENVEMLDVMRANIRKLKTRYPEKFSEELAKEENRDREEEMKAATQSTIPTLTDKLRQLDEELKKSGDPGRLDQRGKVQTICKNCGSNRVWPLKDGAPGDLRCDVCGFVRLAECLSEASVLRKVNEPELGNRFIEVDSNLESSQTPLVQTGSGFAEPPEVDLEGKIETLEGRAEDWDGTYGWSIPKNQPPLPKGDSRPPKGKEPPLDGFAVAREVAKCFAEGKNYEAAIKMIEAHEENYNQFNS